MPATQSELSSWVTSEQSSYSWFLDGPAPQQPLQAYFGLGRDNFVIIDLSTMKVVSIDTGIGNAEPALDALLK